MLYCSRQPNKTVAEDGRARRDGPQRETAAQYVRFRIRHAEPSRKAERDPYAGRRHERTDEREDEQT